MVAPDGSDAEEVIIDALEGSLVGGRAAAAGFDVLLPEGTSR